MSRIFWIIVIVCVVVFGALWFANRTKTHAVNSGDVFVRGQGDAVKTDAAATDSGAAATGDQSAQGTAPAADSQPASQSAAPADGGAVAPPKADSISRNPPNGMIFAGTGKYQLYRQGDITWRLNTDTGQACVLFATDAEWRKPRVFQQGCGGS
jgi:hypothetical protein